MRRKGFFCLCMSALIFVAIAGPLDAWEWSMTGDLEYRFRYWTRTGVEDIFGHMDSNTVNLGINHLATFPTTGTTNAGGSAFGVLAGENRFGPDMSLNEYRMTVYPKIQVNKAIDVTASVNLTSLGIWSDGEPLDNGPASNPGYVNSLYVPIGDRPAASNIPNTYVTLQWLKTSIRTPILNFSIGYKDSSIGMGLWKHKYVRASTSFGVSANYGPLKIGFSPYFARRNSSWAFGSGGTSRNTGSGAIERRDDRRVYLQALFGEIEYASGPLFIQLVSDSYRQPLSHTVNARGAALTGAGISTDDVVRYRIAAAMKYFNGRYFFNTEADWYNTWHSGRGVAAGALGPVNQNEHAAGWAYGAETGVVYGPGKFTVNYVRATGDDPSTRITNEDAAGSEQGVSSAYMKPWGYLMYWMYGTGTTWDADGYGQPTNFHHAGVRLDYAAAANLNIFAVYSNAWRDQPNAYRLGGDYVGGLRTFTNNDILTAQTGGFAGQAVPDDKRYIGWEIDLGIDWKLLENLVWNTTFAWWEPGNWWGAAYPNVAAVYRATGGAAMPAPAAANNALFEGRATQDLGRTISPLMAVETSLKISF